MLGGGGRELRAGSLIVGVGKQGGSNYGVFRCISYPHEPQTLSLFFSLHTHTHREREREGEREGGRKERERERENSV